MTDRQSSLEVEGMGFRRKAGEAEELADPEMAAFVIPLVCALLLLAGCGTPPAQGMTETVTKPAHSVKIAIFEDKTGSTDNAWVQPMRVPPMTVEGIEPLLRLLDRRGGELAYGIISDRSNRGLVRIVIPDPPPEPVEPDSRQNPFLLVEERAAFDKKMGEYREAMDRRKAVVVQQMNFFRDQVGKLTALPRNAPQTDIWGAVRRLELYMNEPLASKVPPHRYAIFATDGIDTSGAPKSRFESGTVLIVVNGSASLGAMEELEPQRFESLESAVAFVLAQEGG